MVYESCYWKDDLRSYATELRDFSTCTTLEDEYRDRVENVGVRVTP